MLDAESTLCTFNDVRHANQWRTLAYAYIFNDIPIMLISWCTSRVLNHLNDAHHAYTHWFTSCIQRSTSCNACIFIDAHQEYIQSCILLYLLRRIVYIMHSQSLTLCTFTGALCAYSMIPIMHIQRFTPCIFIDSHYFIISLIHIIHIVQIQWFTSCIFNNSSSCIFDNSHHAYNRCICNNSHHIYSYYSHHAYAMIHNMHI